MVDYSQENKESFFARLKGRVSPSQLLKIETAYILAKHAHRAQVRKELGPNGDPLRYFEHVRRVALIYIDSTRNTSFFRWEDVCVALLHDTIEDTKDITGEMVELIFGSDIARLVLLLTKDNDKAGYLTKVGTDIRSLYIKLCDRLDNVRHLRSTEVGEEFRVKQKIETREIYIPFFEHQTFDNAYYSFLLQSSLLTELKTLVQKS